MRKTTNSIISMALFVVMLFSLCTFGDTIALAAGGKSDNSKKDEEKQSELSPQDAFLEDMAKGLNNRLFAIDDPDDSASDEEWAEYYKMLVTCELDEIEKYSDTTFEDEDFNRLAHDYIEACKIQLSATKQYGKDTFDSLWSSGLVLRSNCIVELYEKYGLNIRKSDYEGYLEDSSIKAESDEDQYTAMKEAYSKGDYNKSMEYCQKLGNYKDTEKYSDLIKARVIYGYFDTVDEVIEHTKKLIKNIDFADTKDVLVSNYYVAMGYLLGYWSTSNGMHTFEMRDNGGYTTTIPVPPYSGDSVDIEDGILYRYFENNPNKKTDTFKIKPISDTEVEFYAYQTKQTYTLTKRR